MPLTIRNMCRLCSSKDNLVWVFDRRFDSSGIIGSIKNVILLTTGVEIHMSDAISQKVCEKCCQLTIKMFEFRKRALANDKRLKEEYQKHIKDNKIYPEGIINCEPRAKPIHEPTRPPIEIHPSVQDLYRLHPKIKLPAICLNSDIAPCVSLPMDYVEDYFTARKINFNAASRLALTTTNQVAKKKTSSIARLNIINVPRPCSINAQIIPHKRQLEDHSVIRPIKLKIIPKIVSVGDMKDSGTVNQNNHSQEKEANTVTSLCKEPLPENDQDPVASDNEGRLPKKRKASTAEPPETPPKKPNLMDTLGLTPKNTTGAVITTGSSAPLSYIANVSVPLHICNICNSVQYSAKDLKKHQNKHLRCQFCKTRFRTLESKTQHLDNKCLIKNTMNNLPDIEVENIECDMEIRRKYPDAFVDFPPLESNCDKDNSFNNSEDINHNSDNPKIHVDNNVTEDNTIDIIEILSDDEDTPSAEPAKAYNTLQKSMVGNQKVTDRRKENTSDNTATVIKPDVKIKNNSLFDTIDPKTPDTKILKDLLVKLGPLDLFVEKCIQTDLPESHPIHINKNNQFADFKLLKLHMHVYKIPVTIKYGSFNACYKYPSEDLKQPKRLRLWSDLTPVDIKINNIKVGNEGTQVAYDENSHTSNTNCNTLSSSVENNSSTEGLPPPANFTESAKPATVTTNSETEVHCGNNSLDDTNPTGSLSTPTASFTILDSPQALAPSALPKSSFTNTIQDGNEKINLQSKDTSLILPPTATSNSVTNSPPSISSNTSIYNKEPRIESGTNNLPTSNALLSLTVPPCPNSTTSSNSNISFADSGKQVKGDDNISPVIPVPVSTCNASAITKSQSNSTLNSVLLSPTTTSVAAEIDRLSPQLTSSPLSNNSATPLPITDSNVTFSNSLRSANVTHIVVRNNDLENTNSAVSLSNNNSSISNIGQANLVSLEHEALLPHTGTQVKSQLINTQNNNNSVATTTSNHSVEKVLPPPRYHPTPYSRTLQAMSKNLQSSNSLPPSVVTTKNSASLEYSETSTSNNTFPILPSTSYHSSLTTNSTSSHKPFVVPISDWQFKRQKNNQYSTSHTFIPPSISNNSIVEANRRIITSISTFTPPASISNISIVEANRRIVTSTSTFTPPAIKFSNKKAQVENKNINAENSNSSLPPSTSPKDQLAKLLPPPNSINISENTTVQDGTTNPNSVIARADYPLLNNLLDTIPSTSTPPETVTISTTSSSSATSQERHPQPGMIRLKSMWELT